MGSCWPSKSSRTAAAGEGRGGQCRRRRLEFRQSAAIERAQPVIACPRPSSGSRSRGPARIGRGSAAGVRIDRRRRFRPPGSPPGRRDRPMQRRMRTISRRDDVFVRMQLVRSGQRARTRHGDRMAPTRAALGGDQVVVPIALVQMRRLRETDGCALENVLTFADQLALRVRVLLQHDAGKAVATRAMVPELVHQVLATVIVMKQRRIEAAAVEVQRDRTTRHRWWDR